MRLSMTNTSKGLIPIALAVCILLLSFATSRAAGIKVFEGFMGLKVISVEGTIESVDTRKLITAAESLGVPFDTIQVWLNSPGGDVGSLSMGEYIHDHLMQMYIPNNAECISVCTFIWLAGSTRLVDKTARIEWYTQETEDLIIGNRYLGSYIGLLGFNDHAVNKFVTSNIVSLTPELAKELNFEYRIVDGSLFPLKRVYPKLHAR